MALTVPLQTVSPSAAAGGASDSSTSSGRTDTIAVPHLAIPSPACALSSPIADLTTQRPPSERGHGAGDEIGGADEIGHELVGRLLVDLARRADLHTWPSFITAISCESASASLWSWVT